MCSIMPLIILFALPGNMPHIAKICLEIFSNCQLLCLLIYIWILPEHFYGVCLIRAQPGAPNWASGVLLAHLPPGSHHCLSD